MDKLLEGWVKKRLVRNIHGIEVDVTRIKDRRYFVKKAYQILSSTNHPEDSNVIQWRTLLVQCLENLLNTEFKNTRDLRQKVEKYLKGYNIRKGTAAERIQRARKKKKLTQKELAKDLGYKSHVAIAQFEKGLRYPPKKVFEWLEGVENAGQI
jgi:DNA-binding XRE family transcriptional regulator